MKRNGFLAAAAAGALLSTAPAAAFEPADPPVPTPGAAASPSLPPPACDAAAPERAALEAERAEVNAAIGDIALGRRVKRRKVSGGEVAAGAAGTVASVLLPFGVGALLSAGAGAVARSGRKKRKPAPPLPDVPAMIDRLRAIDARLAELGACA